MALAGHPDQHQRRPPPPPSIRRPLSLALTPWPVENKAGGLVPVSALPAAPSPPFPPPTQPSRPRWSGACKQASIRPLFPERHSCPGIRLRQRKRSIAFEPGVTQPKGHAGQSAVPAPCRRGWGGAIARRGHWLGAGSAGWSDVALPAPCWRGMGRGGSVRRPHGPMAWCQTAAPRRAVRGHATRWADGPVPGQPAPPPPPSPPSVLQ